jgi:CrcB protein
LNLSYALLAGVGGFIGSILRYWLSGVAQGWAQDRFPLGTLMVNAVGCLVIGAFVSLFEYRQWFSPEVRIFVTVGILGGFTTFSAFGYETFRLLLDGEYLWAVTNVMANVVIGLSAVTIGWFAAKAIAT